MGKTTESPLSNVTPKPTGTTTIFDELCHLPKAQQQWENRTYISFDDGDIRDSLDILTLENEHLCGQSEPEFTTRAGGRYQDTSLTDFVGIGLNRDDSALSFEITNAADSVFAPVELAETFVWYVVIDTRTNTTTVHYADPHLSMAFSQATWAQWQQWLITYQPLLHVHEYRQFISPYSPNYEEKAMLFLVVYHPEGEEPRSALAEAPNEDVAWDAVAERHHLNAGTSPEDEELYLDHTKVLDSMLKEAQAPYILTSTR